MHAEYEYLPLRVRGPYRMLVCMAEVPMHCLPRTGVATRTRSFSPSRLNVNVPTYSRTRTRIFAPGSDLPLVRHEPTATSTVPRTDDGLVPSRVKCTVVATTVFVLDLRICTGTGSSRDSRESRRHKCPNMSQIQGDTNQQSTYCDGGSNICD
eukprot:scaffold132680_cov17-Prasinocladus_malaysianus.AAC.1